jgi:uncharacterized protein YqeY
MEDSRIARIEMRVDEIKDDVAELKADGKIQREVLRDIKDDIKNYNVTVKGHVAGDEKIISELVPLLKILPDMISDYNYNKKKKELRDERLKLYATKLGIISVSVGIIYTAVKLFSGV